MVLKSGEDPLLSPVTAKACADADKAAKRAGDKAAGKLLVVEIK